MKKEQTSIIISAVLAMTPALLENTLFKYGVKFRVPKIKLKNLRIRYTEKKVVAKFLVPKPIRKSDEEVNRTVVLVINENCEIINAYLHKD